MADSDTQALLSKLLQDAGVSDLRIQTFFDHVQKFNNVVDPAWLTTGFENAKPSDLKYDPYSMQDAWTEKYDTFPGWNCRITACGLFGDFITVTGKADLDSAEDTLFMDYETLDSDPESLCGDERQKFDALFAPVKTCLLYTSHYYCTIATKVFQVVFEGFYIRKNFLYLILPFEWHKMQNDLLRK